MASYFSIPIEYEMFVFETVYGKYLWNGTYFIWSL